MSDAEGRIPCLGTERWGYKCSLCTIIFSSHQGLAGHMQSHRFDDAYQKGSSHQRVLYRPITFQSSSSVRNNVVSRHPPPLLPPPPPVRFRPPVSGVTHRCHVSAAIRQPSFGGLGLGSSWSPRPRPAVALPPPGNGIPVLPRDFGGESSSGRTVIIDPRGWFAARRGGGGGDGKEEEVTPRYGTEVDTELRLGH